MLGVALGWVAAFVAALVLTGLTIRIAPRIGWIDVPNERSMHVRPTPRGGGAAIALCTLVAVLVAAVRGEIPVRGALALLLGAAVAVLGGLDDKFHLRDGVRLAVWIVIAVAATLLVGGLSTLDLGAWLVPLGVSGGVLLVVGVVWAINLYNFMDGIDGIAAAQALIASAAGAMMLFTAGLSGLGFVAGVLAAASAGFLLWNRPPARIFMGDVGSGFIGFTMALLAVLSERQGGPPIVVWAILLAPFLIDPTFTVVRRALAGEAFYRPHRSHAYQRAVQRGRTHATVALAYAGMALALVPVAWAAWLWPSARLPIAAAVVVTLGLLWRREVASRRDAHIPR